MVSREIWINQALVSFSKTSRTDHVAQLVEHWSSKPGG